MVELLLDNYVSEVWVVCIVGFITFLSGEVCLTSSLVPLISTAASFTVVVIAVIVSLRPPPRALLELFGHTVLLEMTYFIAYLAPNIDTSSWLSGGILLFLLLS